MCDIKVSKNLSIMLGLAESKRVHDKTCILKREKESGGNAWSRVWNMLLCEKKEGRRQAPSYTA